MDRRSPRISIGMPVYNGEPFVEEAIRSVLAQTYDDLELIISDNASTDGTQQICQRYADQDPRVIYIRNKENIGAARNFNQAFQHARGELFKWNTGDNAIAPEFLERCVEVLDSRPEAVVAFTRCRQRNEFEDTERVLEIERDLDTDITPIRFRRLFTQVLGMQDPIWGLMRTKSLKQTHLIRSFPGADDCFLVELVLQGHFVEVPEHLLLLRIHPDGYHALGKRRKWWQRNGDRPPIWASGPDRQGILRQARWFDPRNTRRIYFPHWRRLREFSSLVMKSDASGGDKLRMLGFLVRLAIHRRYILLTEAVHVADWIGESFGGGSRQVDSA